MSRILTIWLPRWPVQRRLLERSELRRVPVFVCRRERRGVMKVVSWAWAAPPRSSWQAGPSGPARPAGSFVGGAVAAARIHEGMSLAEGMAVLASAYGSRACQIAEVDHDDPDADRTALEELARSCRRFAPIVAIEEPAARGPSRPECLHVDVTGTADFFGGEGALVRTAVWTLASRGIHARAAIADTPTAAWAAAHHTDSLAAGSAPVNPRARGSRHRRWAVVPAGGQQRMLAALPAAALGLDADVLTQLEGVGIETIGDVVRLPRKSLASRFDPQLSQRLARFIGERAEPLAVPCSAELPTATHAFDFPLALRDATADDVTVILERLVGECIGPLAALGKGVMMLQVRLDRSQVSGDGEPSAPMIFDVGMFQPTIAVKHVVELVLLRMARLRLPWEIAAITVDVVSAGQASCRQRTLFGEPAEVSASQVGMLLDRLSGRLGRRAVFEPLPVPDVQPEHAWVAVPPMQATRRRGTSVSPPSSAKRKGWSQRHDGGHVAIASAPQRRPIWMLPRPVRLEVIVAANCVEPSSAGAASVAAQSHCQPTGVPLAGFRLEGRMHEIVKAHGPERIETAWWRGPTVRRDYYVVETNDGGRYWIFRRLDGSRRVWAGGLAEAWFLHGMFS